jgi:Rab GTPase-binding effector protein 1
VIIEYYLLQNDLSTKVAKEALERKWQMEILVLKNQLLSEQQSKETLENSLTGEIDYLREQLGMMRSVQTQLDEESSRKASLEVALQQAKEQLSDIKDRASESISSKVIYIYLLSCRSLLSLRNHFIGQNGK